LALWFGLHVLFGEVGSLTAGPLTLPAPELATFDWRAAAIAVAAGIALLRFKMNLLVVLAAAMAAGAMLSLV
jgi:chromate transporter